MFEMDDGLGESTGSQAIGTGARAYMNPLQWSFMSEPAWKWGAFVIIMSLFLSAWGGVIRYMK